MHRIKKYIQESEVVYGSDINKQHSKVPCLLDKRAFAKIKHLLI